MTPNSLNSLPNRLTVSRIFAIPLVLWLMLHGAPWADLAAGLLFILASLTDVLDGYLARKYNSVSQMGKLLDPLADKLLVISVLIVLQHLGSVHYLIVVLLIGREFAVNSLRGIATEEGVVIAASPLAKHKTATQITAVTVLMLDKSVTLFGLDWHRIGTWLLYAATVLALLSAYQYFASYRVGSMRDTKGRG